MRLSYLLTPVLVLAGSSLAYAQQDAEDLLSVDFQVYLWRGTPPAPAALESENAQDFTETSFPENIQNAASASAEMRSDIHSEDVVQQYRAPEISYMVNDLGEYRDIRAAEGRLSRSYSYSGLNPLQFFRTDGSGEGATRTLLGSVQLDPTYQQVLLLFLPDRNNPGKFRILPINNSAQRIPPGKAMLYNFTGQELACLLGEEQFMLPSGAYRPIDISTVENYTLPVQLATNDESGQWKRVHLENKSLDPNSSLLMIIHRPGSGRLYRILTLKNENLISSQTEEEDTDPQELVP